MSETASTKAENEVEGQAPVDTDLLGMILTKIAEEDGIITPEEDKSAKATESQDKHEIETKPSIPPMNLRTRNLPPADELLSSILKLRGWDKRSGQFKMAREIGHALEDGTYDIISNAPVGIGKSLAYLSSMLPSDRHGIICTSTRSLQDQLIDSELPDLARDLKELYDYDLTYQVIKGKSNYLCLDSARRILDGDIDEDDDDLAMLFGLGDEDFDLATYDMQPLRDLMEDIEARMERSKGGEVGVILDCGDKLQALPQNIRKSVTASKCINHGGKWWEDIDPDTEEGELDDGSVIPNKGALPHSEIIRTRICPLGLAYALSISSDVAVLNTSLLAAELQKSESMPFPTMPTQIRAADLVVVDEAHHLVRIITDSMRIQLDTNKVADSATTLVRRLSKHFPEDEDKINNNFNRYTKSFKEDSSSILNEKEPDLRGTLSKVFWDYKAHIQSTTDRITDLLSQSGIDDAKTRRTINRNMSRLGEDAIEVLVNTAVSLNKKSEIEQEGEKFKAELAFNMSAEFDPDENNWSIDLVPIDISFLREMFESVRETENIYLESCENPHFKVNSAKRTSLILCSGTITDTVADSIGIHEDDYEFLNVKSPFDDFASRIYVPSGGVWPKDEDAWLDQSVEIIKKAINKAGGRTMVLTTSQRLSDYFAYEIQQAQGRGEVENYPMVFQGGPWTRKEMLEEMAQDERCLLFGTKGFWEGVNLPGNALLQVIIDKVPFPMRNDPAVEARRTFVARTKGNPFALVDCDMAAIDLEQGRGRLIRSVDDIGGVIILDPRVTDAQYGSQVTKLFPGEMLFTSKFDKYEAWMEWCNPDNGHDQEEYPSEIGWKSIRPARRTRKK